jgi:hypothetical protein
MFTLCVHIYCSNAAIYIVCNGAADEINVEYNAMPSKYSTESLFNTHRPNPPRHSNDIKHFPAKPAHVGCELLALVGVLGDIILDNLALSQGAEALCQDGGLVHEHVVTPLVGGDEAEALDGVEELHLAGELHLHVKLHAPVNKRERAIIAVRTINLGMCIAVQPIARKLTCPSWTRWA